MIREQFLAKYVTLLTTTTMLGATIHAFLFVSELVNEGDFLMFLVLSHFLCPVSRSSPFVIISFHLQGSERGIGAAIHFFVVAFCFSAVG